MRRVQRIAPSCRAPEPRTGGLRGRAVLDLNGTESRSSVPSRGVTGNHAAAVGGRRRRLCRCRHRRRCVRLRPTPPPGSPRRGVENRRRGRDAVRRVGRHASHRRPRCERRLRQLPRRHRVRSVHRPHVRRNDHGAAASRTLRSGRNTRRGADGRHEFGVASTGRSPHRAAVHADSHRRGLRDTGAEQHGLTPAASDRHRRRDSLLRTPLRDAGTGVSDERT
ncbi:hypothetical protein QE418_000134 [Microbacterium testaceum]|nr:hypothetical protein [Microbacterium testaceum]MDR6098767.1 hypothetical protein [Microbacterium sp. SORGH_AS_0454]